MSSGTPSTTGGADDPGEGPPRGTAGTVWVGSILAAVVLVLLLVFVVQNGGSTRIDFLVWSGTLPTGVALLFAAVAGVLLVAIPGSARILQLRKAARRGPADAAARRD
jgi:uncharacterized integral membrane protein